MQLLSRGLFPCAPSFPTLAVDLNMLDFVHELFVNSAPNITAWCETLEGFLNDRQFKLSTRVRAAFIFDLSPIDLILKYRIVYVVDSAALSNGIPLWWIQRSFVCRTISIVYVKLWWKLSLIKVD